MSTTGARTPTKAIPAAGCTSAALSAGAIRQIHFILSGALKRAVRWGSRRTTTGDSGVAAQFPFGLGVDAFLTVGVL